MKALFLISLVLVGGCGIFEPASDEEEQLANALAGWKRQGITDYNYVYSRTCECPPEWQRPYLVVVEDGKVTGATDFATGAVRPHDRMPTIDDLFNMIDKALDENADVVRIVYDRSLFYPINMMIDSDLAVGDDEQIMQASALHRLK
jgi:hypothetical protein